ncbi:hypothetical protein B0H14DRAFT_2600912 [Mycena olivaceomarginata]|nr:hypothetical protein B0H14DRAFT_2600912 [Mycena olivaceomarginata]
MVTAKLVLVALPKVFDGVTEVRLVAYIQVLTRLGLPYYYAHIVLPLSLLGTSKLASVLSKHPWIGPHVRSRAGDYVLADSMLAILSRTTGLVQFHGNISSNQSYFDYFKPSTIPAFPGMLVRSDGGYTLRECHADIGPPKHASALTTAFNELTALRILTWKCQGDFLNVTNPSVLAASGGP